MVTTRGRGIGAFGPCDRPLPGHLIAPLPPALSPMPDYVRGPYSSWKGGCDASLLALRDRVFTEHLGLPQEF